MKSTSRNIYIPVIAIALIMFLLSGCSSSVDNRYKKRDTTGEKDEITSTKDSGTIDLSAYKTNLPISRERRDPTIRTAPDLGYKGIWTGYGDKKKESTLMRAYGFRVLMAETEDYKEAENIRTDLYFNTVARRIYIDFETPFYKVKIGDFTNSFDAKEYSFKLSQLGFKNTSIVRDSINIYK